jgi:hypothetical protein
MIKQNLNLQKWSAYARHKTPNQIKKKMLNFTPNKHYLQEALLFCLSHLMGSDYHVLHMDALIVPYHLLETVLSLFIYNAIIIK